MQNYLVIFGVHVSYGNVRFGCKNAFRSDFHLHAADEHGLFRRAVYRGYADSSRLLFPAEQRKRRNCRYNGHGLSTVAQQISAVGKARNAHAFLFGRKRNGHEVSFQTPIAVNCLCRNLHAHSERPGRTEYKPDGRALDKKPVPLFVLHAKKGIRRQQ